jgi:anti-sigma factor RsiW
MKPDPDDSYLSAYLDHELAPGPRQEVEARLASDAGSAEQLAGLGSVHRAVADLPRPEAPCRLASAVLARVAAARSARSRRPVYWVATAASLAFACLLADRSGLFPRRAPALVAERIVPRVADPAPVTADPVLPTPPPATRPVVAERLGPAPDREGEARRRLIAMLDGPGLGRIVVPTGPGEPDAAGRVEGLLRESARKNPEYVRMTVPAGVGVDPEHPEGGEIMVAVMDDRERREFLARLGREGVLPQRVSDPRLGTMLAELDGLALGSGRSAAGLKPLSPEAGVALRHPDIKDKTVVPEHPQPGQFPRDLMAEAPVVVAEPADEPDEGLVGPPAPPGARRARPRGPAPVVIWVLPSGSGGAKD